LNLAVSVCNIFELSPLACHHNPSLANLLFTNTVTVSVTYWMPV